MQPQQPYYGPAPQSPRPNYDFITGPGQGPKHHLSLGKLSSGRRIVRLIMVLMALIIIIIIYGIIKGILSGPSDVPSLLSVAQDQQEIIHLTSNANTQVSASAINLSADNQNFAISAELVMTSAQSNLITYLANNGHKIKTTQLDTKQSTSLDNQLTSAGQANDYDQTFSQIMKTQLDTYEQDLQTAYNVKTLGPKGHAMLNTDYKGAQLLLKQLLSPAS